MNSDPARRVWLRLHLKLPSWRGLACFAWTILLFYFASQAVRPWAFQRPLLFTYGESDHLVMWHRSTSLPIAIVVLACGAFLRKGPRRRKFALLAVALLLALALAWWMNEARRLRAMLRNAHTLVFVQNIHRGEPNPRRAVAFTLTDPERIAALAEPWPFQRWPGWQWNKFFHYGGIFTVEALDQNGQLLGQFDVVGSSMRAIRFPSDTSLAPDRFPSQEFQNALDAAMLAGLPPEPPPEGTEERDRWIWLTLWTRQPEALHRIQSALPSLTPAERLLAINETRASAQTREADFLLQLADDPTTHVRYHARLVLSLTPTPSAHPSSP